MKTSFHVRRGPITLLKCALALTAAVFVLAGATKADAQYTWDLTDVSCTTNVVQYASDSGGGLTWFSSASAGTGSFYEDEVSVIELDVTNVTVASELVNTLGGDAYTTNSVNSSVEFDVSGVFVCDSPPGEAPSMDFGMEVSFDVLLFNNETWSYTSGGVCDALSFASGSYSGAAPDYSYFYSANGAEVALHNTDVTEGDEYQTAGGVGYPFADFNYATFSVYVNDFYTSLPEGSSPLYVAGSLGIASEATLGAHSGGNGGVQSDGIIADGHIKISLF